MREDEIGHRVWFTPAALSDLEGIWDYIAMDSPDTASAVVKTIPTAVSRLSDFPLMGHPRDDLADETLRVWPVHSYLIIYRPVSSAIQIIRVVSGFQDLLAVFSEE